MQPEPPFNIEALELGVWSVVDFTFDLDDAFSLASAVASYLGEDRIRILDNQNREL